MVLVGLCVFGFLLGSLQNSSHLKDRVDPVSSVIRSLLSPLGSALNACVRSVGSFAEGTLSSTRLVRENRRLKALEQSFALYSDTIGQVRAECEMLRKMAGFGPPAGKARVPALVYGFSINENRLTINVGSNQGVKAGCPVESADGLVGTVEDVEANRSQVLLLTSAGLQPNSNGKPLLIGAIDINRNPPPAGLLRGENASTLTLTFMDPKAPVQIGDTIVTSGFSEKIPRGLVIGKVIQIDPSEEFGTLKARIDPAFSLGNLEFVFVLT
ncbi:MAG: rod shape-determining protein MreC [Fimbriimonas sp.]|nr:rod shape-determining protein MreC [Fimbriimonas sp.]